MKYLRKFKTHDAMTEWFDTYINIKGSIGLGMDNEKKLMNVIPPDYFCFENLFDGENVVSIKTWSFEANYTGVQNIEWSKDKKTWTIFNISDIVVDNEQVEQPVCTLQSGECVYFRGNEGKFSTSIDYISFNTSQ